MTEHLLRRLSAILIAVLLLAPALPAAAQPAPARDGLEIEKLVSTLKDDKARDQLVRQLETLLEARRAAKAAEDDTLLGQLSQRLDDFGDQVMAALSALADVPRLVDWTVGQLADELVRKHWGEVLARLAGVLGAAVAADQLLVALVVRARRRSPPTPKPSPLARVVGAVLRGLVDLGPILAAAGAAFGSAGAMGLAGNERMAATLLVGAFAAVRTVMVAARLLASPRLPALRLIPVDDETAEYLVIWVRRLAGVGVFGWFAAEAARRLGLPAGVHLMGLHALGLVIAAMLVIFIAQNRRTVAERLRDTSERPLLGGRVQALTLRLADVWHVLAIAYVAAVYSVWALGIKGGFEFMLRATVLTVVILALAGAVSALLARAVDRGFAISQEARDRFPLLEARANRYLPILHLILRGAVSVITVVALAQSWGLDILGLLATDAGRRALGSAISIAVVLVAALVVWELVHGAVERYLSAADVQRSARVRTLLPLVRNAVFLVLLAMVTLIVLSELGVNIAPLLAGAGVVGIAIGFGSQKLVQDIITGAFILFEDTIAVGDVVKLGGDHAGAVEAMSIRAIRLRDAQGSVHTIPFSSVSTVVNLTKGFNYAVFDVGVAYREDTDRVAEAMTAVGTEMRTEDRWRAAMVEPLEVLGVERFEASSVVVRARVKTAPSDKWTVAREFNRRIKKRFDELGIEMPFPQTTVWFGEGKGPAALVE